MIGKHVPKEELEELLTEEKDKSDLIRRLNEELEALKPGECLVYETKEGTESLLGLSFGFSNIKDLKLMTRPGKVYAYKKC